MYCEYVTRIRRAIKQELAELNVTWSSGIFPKAEYLLLLLLLIRTIGIMMKLLYMTTTSEMYGMAVWHHKHVPQL